MKFLIQHFLYLFFLSCSTNIDSNRSDSQIIDFIVILESPFYFENQNLINVILKSKEDEQSFLNNTHRIQYWTSSGESYFPDFPEVDYKNDMVLGILLGMRNIGNTIIRIDSIEEVSGKLIVNSTEVLPSTHEAFIGYPTVFAKIIKLDLPVVFGEIAFIKE